MRRRGRPILGAFAGLFFGLFLDLALLVWSVLALNSIALVVIPLVTLVLGIAWGLWAPLGGRQATAPTA